MDNTPTIHRHRGHVRAADSSLKGGEPVKSALWRGIAMALVLAVAMFGGFRLAKRYLQRDWSERVEAAREAGRGRGGADDAAATVHSGLPSPGIAPVRWMPHLGPVAAAAQSVRRTLPGPDGAQNAWLLLAHVSRGEVAERALWMASASGESPGRVEIERGRKALLAGRPSDALAAYRRALAAKPGWPRALVGEALAASRLGKREEALSALAAYLSGDPHNPQLIRLAAFLLADGERHEEGLALLERELDAGGAPALYLDAAQLAASARQPLAAARYLEAALAHRLPLSDIARLFNGPLFDDFRATPDGQAFRRRLAAAARAQWETERESTP